jgi:putative SOS response-associated peptidase YedK
MCGRYSFAIEDELIRERFGVSVRNAVYKARYNCAPSQDLAVISTEEPEILSFYRWGLIPFWAKDPSIGNKLINVRAETIADKPSFKQAFRNRRCLVLSDGFFEWEKMREKTPYRIVLQDNVPFSMAGIWEKWKNPEGVIIHSFSIITTTANSLIEEIHDRMPVILKREDEKKWLSPADESELLDLLRPYPSEQMIKYAVSRKVNSPVNDIPEILEPVEIRLLGC